MALRLVAGEGCRLRLPVRMPQAADRDLPAFEPAEISPPLAVEMLRSPRRENTLAHDRVGGWTTLTLVNDEGRLKFPHNGLETDHRSTEIMRVREGDPLSLSQRIGSVLEFRRDEWRVRVETESLMTADATHFHLSNHMDGYEGDVRVFTKSWTRKIPRDNV